MFADGTFDLLPKKEVILLKKEAAKLEKNLGGIKEMRRLPNALFVVDPKAEHNAVAEAKILGILYSVSLILTVILMKLIM